MTINNTSGCMLYSYQSGGVRSCVQRGVEVGGFNLEVFELSRVVSLLQMSFSRPGTHLRGSLDLKISWQLVMVSAQSYNLPIGKKERIRVEALGTRQLFHITHIYTPEFRQGCLTILLSVLWYILYLCAYSVCI